MKKNYTDEEIIQMMRDGQPELGEKLLVKYKPMVISKATKMYILGAERDDLIQEGMIGLYKATTDYDPGRDASFFTFADLCVTRHMYNAVTASNRQKHIPLNSYISLYAPVGTENEEALLIDTVVNSDEDNPEEVLIDRENVERLEHMIDEQLSSFEKKVLDLHLTGMGYVEIAKILGKEEKSTDNALQRIRTKIKKIVSNIK